MLYFLGHPVYWLYVQRTMAVRGCEKNTRCHFAVFVYPKKVGHFFVERLLKWAASSNFSADHADL